MKTITQNKLKTSLIKDVKNTIGSIHKMNARSAKGYLFNPTNDGKSISKGMYCDFESEINVNQWTYFINFNKDKFNINEIE